MRIRMDGELVEALHSRYLFLNSYQKVHISIIESEKLVKTFAQTLRNNKGIETQFMNSDCLEEISSRVFKLKSTTN